MLTLRRLGRVLAYLSMCALLQGSGDSAVWRAYEAVEEAWMQEKCGLLVQQAPGASMAAQLNLELDLAELKLHAMQFRHLQKCEPPVLNPSVWQLTALHLSAEESAHVAALPEYRKQEEHIRQLNETLRHHPQYEILRRAQSRLWKTPQYREAHRRYTGRLQELQQLYGPPPAPSVSTVN